MEREGFRLIRFGDDFVLLVHSKDAAPDIMKKVQTTLAKLGLSLHPQKTKQLLPGTDVEFLGYLVNREEIRTRQKVDEPPEEDWLPVFRPDWRQGLPVYITSICRGAFSSGPHLVVKQTDDSKQSIPWNRVSRMVVVGRGSFSGGVIYRAMREKIPVTFIDVMGRATGNLSAPGQFFPNHSVAQKKHLADPEWLLTFSSGLIVAKIYNSMILLRRNDRDVKELKGLTTKAKQAESLESLRGIEGTAARIYFDHFSSLVTPFEFKKRVYHPPDGPINVMLSFGYTLLHNRLAAALSDNGFDTRTGFFHKGRGRHQALASDLIEPLRHLIDRIVLALIHLNEVTLDDFTVEKNKWGSCCRMNGKGFRKYISRYEWTMASRFTAPNGRKMTYNEWLEKTVDDLRRDVCYAIPYKPLNIY